MSKFKFLFIFLCLVSSVTQAWLRPSPGEFGVEGEALWLKAALDDTYFAIENSVPAPSLTVLVGERAYREFGFRPGYRLEAAYTFCNCVNDIRLRYTHFSASAHETLTSGFSNISPTQPPGIITQVVAQNTAVAQMDINFYAVDLVFGHLLYSCNPLTFEVQLGLEYAHLKVKENYAYGGNGTFVLNFLNANYRNIFNGIGPEIAFDSRYDIPYCLPLGEFSLVCNGKAALLISSNESRLQSSLLNSGFVNNTRDEKSWRVTPAVELQIGFNYLVPCNWCVFSIEAGYEVMSYFGAVQKTRYMSTQPSSTSFEEYGDFSLHGPYLAVDVIF